MRDWDGPGSSDITCRELVELVTDYLEDQLGAATRALFEQHVTMCRGCRRYLWQVEESTRLLGRVTLETISPEARANLTDAFRRWNTGRREASERI